jgi:hypothetical protein
LLAVGHKAGHARWSGSERPGASRAKVARLVADTHPIHSQSTSLESTLKEDSRRMLGLVSTCLKGILQPSESPLIGAASIVYLGRHHQHSRMLQETRAACLARPCKMISTNVLALARRDGIAMQRFAKVAHLDAQKWQLLESHCRIVQFKPSLSNLNANIITYIINGRKALFFGFPTVPFMIAVQRMNEEIHSASKTYILKSLV